MKKIQLLRPPLATLNFSPSLASASMLARPHIVWVAALTSSLPLMTIRLMIYRSYHQRSLTTPSYNSSCLLSIFNLFTLFGCCGGGNPSIVGLPVLPSAIPTSTRLVRLLMLLRLTNCLTFTPTPRRSYLIRCFLVAALRPVFDRWLFGSTENAISHAVSPAVLRDDFAGPKILVTVWLGLPSYALFIVSTTTRRLPTGNSWSLVTP